MSIFSKRLEAKRKEKGITQTETAKRLGIVQSTCAYYERGNRKPDLEMLEAIANILQTIADYLVGRTKK